MFSCFIEVGKRSLFQDWPHLHCERSQAIAVS
jgi:hypothetical protein